MQYFKRVGGFRKYFGDDGTHVHFRTVYDITDKAKFLALVADWSAKEDAENPGMYNFEFSMNDEGTRATLLETQKDDAAN